MAAGSVEVLLVSYQSAPLITALLDSWGEAFPVLIVDNANDADGLQAIVAERRDVRCESVAGLGYARAVNRGIRRSNADVVVLVNPDSRADASQIVDLAQGLTRDDSAVVHGALDGLPGGGYHGGGWLPTPSRWIVHAFGISRLLPTRGIVLITPTPQSQGVDWVAGAAIAVKRQDFLELGGFDERFFVYWECIAFGHVARRSGRRMVIRDDIVLTPDSSGSGAPSLEMARLHGASTKYYIEGYLEPWNRAVAKTAMILGFLLRAILAALRGRRPGALRNVAFVQGLISGRAAVAGREVSRARARETLLQETE